MLTDPLFSHQYGWDEALLFVVPIAIAVVIAAFEWARIAGIQADSGRYLFALLLFIVSVRLVLQGIGVASPEPLWPGEPTLAAYAAVGFLAGALVKRGVTALALAAGSVVFLDGLANLSLPDTAQYRRFHEKVEDTTRQILTKLKEETDAER